MTQNQQTEHQMILQHVDPSGIEEWYCPTCGRRFLLQWPPEYRKVILDAGDENAIHSGGKSGCSNTSISSVREDGPAYPKPGPLDTAHRESMPVEELGPVGANDPTLLPWLEWMERVDFESLWRK
jgi:hypothetical protein